MFSILAVDRSSSELQWLLDLVQNDPVHYIRSVMISNTVSFTVYNFFVYGSLINKASKKVFLKIMNSVFKVSVVK